MPSRADEIAQLHARVLELEVELADERGRPRPGENVRLQVSGMGPSGLSMFAQDRRTGVLVHGEGRTELDVRRRVLALLRQATSPEHVDLGWPKSGSLHCSICACPACGHMGLTSEDDEEEEAGASPAAGGDESFELYMAFWRARGRASGARTLTRTANAELADAIGAWLPVLLQERFARHPLLTEVRWREGASGAHLDKIIYDGQMINDSVLPLEGDAKEVEEAFTELFDAVGQAGLSQLVSTAGSRPVLLSATRAGIREL